MFINQNKKIIINHRIWNIKISNNNNYINQNSNFNDILEIIKEYYLKLIFNNKIRIKL